MSVEKDINSLIKSTGADTNLISDGYHTFGQLYDHRIVLWIELCKFIHSFLPLPVWRSRVHSDGSKWDGWFLLGVGKDPGTQMTYHLPMSEWEECSFCPELEIAPEFDGHTSDDVLKRIKNLDNYESAL